MVKPTKNEITKALDTINGLAFFAANHGWTEPVPELVKIMDYLRHIQTEGYHFPMLEDHENVID